MAEAKAEFVLQHRLLRPWSHLIDARGYRNAGGVWLGRRHHSTRCCDWSLRSNGAREFRLRELIKSLISPLRTRLAKLTSVCLDRRRPGILPLLLSPKLFSSPRPNRTQKSKRSPRLPTSPTTSWPLKRQKPSPVSSSDIASSSPRLASTIARSRCSPTIITGWR